MSEREPPGGDAEFEAAEYALGVLEGAERLKAERRSAIDPAFAQDVGDWQVRLSGLVDEIASQTPPTHVWPGVVQRLEGSSGVVELRLRRSLAVWRSATAVAAAVAASLVGVLVWPQARSPAAPMLTARLSASATGPTVFVALYDPSRRAIVLTPASVSAAQGRSPELWLIPAGGKPIPLGVAAFQTSVQLIPAASLVRAGGGTLAVSVEPLGGSPTGQPTGPVIATGQLSSL